ncbi:unnamed protein product [Dibothriocephalus latus]|uniref:Uncharacterized protein n=1 Tax=Dibothriocephalus latus TaxID=60516 RepID=A0A3P6TJV4_DIBLA|nr:unnamed protein product [Dibothriocephalus latus]
MLISNDPEYQQLPRLFLRNFFCAADIFQLFECFDEPIAYRPYIWTRILSVWPLCLLHLFFHNTMRSEGSITPDTESLSPYDPKRPPAPDPESQLLLDQEDRKENNLSLEAMKVDIYVWADILSGLVLDMQLLYLRRDLLSQIDLFEPQIHFFIIKNMVLMLAQVCRAAVILQRQIRKV